MSNDERAQFEAWAAGHHFDLMASEDGYLFAETGTAWDAWQARAAIAQPAEPAYSPRDDYEDGDSFAGMDRAAQADAQPVAPAYGSTDFGFTFAGLQLAEGDKRLLSMLTIAFGNDHPAFDDLVALVFAARTKAAAPPARQPLTEQQMYEVEETARTEFRKSQVGPRGQMLTYWDSLTPWLIRATERAHGIGEGE